MVTQVTAYREAGRQLLTQARAGLDAGDLRQASEKGWGAAAQLVKAAAQARGWRHRAHRLLFEVAEDLTEEVGDTDIQDLFGSARLLHINFYENNLDGDTVAHYLEHVERLLAKLEALLDG